MEQTDRFWVAAEDGDQQEILEFRHTIPVKPLASPQRTLLGAREYFFGDGRAVNPIDSDKYEDVETGKIYSRVK